MKKKALIKNDFFEWDGTLGASFVPILSGSPLSVATPRIGRMQFALTAGYSLLSGVGGMLGCFVA